MIALPQDVAFIIHKIEKAGFEAFAVGGCIRDSLLSRTPNDWDITTSALPEQVKALFEPKFSQIDIVRDLNGFGRVLHLYNA